ncbi:ceramide very long chain fatty acid hydroxylase [Elysia marginata]|uniref:Ceramide very long chain fatty acid hydroxylase n=1 Tax=Elysia marginata TaxID=1093978 RepID=A0AAV4I9F7_9GAST|nr:ceramide very long chain fatty acid hydroxylase [Elysia marginata]
MRTPRTPRKQKSSAMPRQTVNNENDQMGASSPRIIITLDDCLYDVTEFADRHPGGRELLVKHNGRNVRDVMQDRNIHVHSKAAYTILDKYVLKRTKNNTYKGGRDDDQVRVWPMISFK